MRLATVLRVLVTVTMLAGVRGTAAPDEPPTCTLELKALGPQFTAKLPPHFKLLSTKLDLKARRMTQEVLLPEGTKVTVKVGGCEHLSQEFLIRNKALTTKTVGAEVVAVVRRVLPQLPVDKNALANPKLLLRAVEEGTISQLPAQLPCGDATCQLSVEPDEKPKPVKTKAKAEPKSEDDEPKPRSLEEGPGLIRLSYDLAL